MKTAGIIAEYNPFHLGHKYHIDTIKEQTGADYVIVVMSGNFTQRGTPALLDKYTRTQMALLNGVDLVIELPLYYACGSAEYFSMGAVTLLDKLGIVDFLGFGSECGSIHPLKEAARLLIEEPDNFRCILKEYLKKGFSYPHARSRALAFCLKEKTEESLFSSPNNILGIEYCKALAKRKSTIQPKTIARIGAGYHDADPLVPICSALAIRNSLLGNSKTKALKSQLPDNIYPLLEEAARNGSILFSSDFSLLLHYTLLQKQSEGYLSYQDVSQDLSNRIQVQLSGYKDYDSFLNLLKTKDITFSRVSRCLLHILLDMKKEHLAQYIGMDYTPYARILGLNPAAGKLFSSIKKQSDIPLLSKLADAKKLLSPSAFSMLTEEIQASRIYTAVQKTKCGLTIPDEYRQPLRKVMPIC